MTNPVNDTYRYFEQCSAYLASELGTFMGEVDPDVMQMAYNHVFHVESSRFITPTGLQLLLQDPDLCGRMLIWLIENHLISVEELGK